MKRLTGFACLIILLFVISGCGNNQIEDPADTLDTYISKWTEKEFNAMYEMLTANAKDTYTSDDFIERYEKLYTDLEIQALKITPAALTKEENKQAKKDKEVTLPLEISMESIAGPITFERDIHLQLVEIDDKNKTKQWQIDWEEGLIFPGLEKGGKVTIERENPRRGDILDRNQMPLAINAAAYEVGIVPNWMENETNEIENVAKILSFPVSHVKELLHADWVQPDYFVPLKTISQTEDVALDQLKLIPGVSIKETFGRSYPSGEAAAHLTGYIGTITKEELDQLPEGAYDEDDMIGKRGLEQLYEEELKGKKGIKIVIVTEKDGEEHETILAETPVQNGKNIQISIDINAQERVFEAFNHKAGTAAAIDAKTGEILALVSSPAFNPNQFVYGISQSDWDALSEDPKNPLLNRFSATYAPGSVMKPITAAIGLKNGAITHNEGLEINGLTWSKKGWGDVEVTRVSSTSQPVDLKLALTNSDNIYFAMKAIDMGSKAYLKGLKEFGFDEKLPVAYPITPSQISNSGDLDEILLANTSYGQGEVEMSALHVALSYTPFLNDGNMIQPSFLKKDKKGEVWAENILSKEDANKMKEYLRAVVEEGTGGKAKDSALAISGKTGTAELKASKESKGHQNGWFVGYPSEKENIIVAMMMEKTDVIGGSGIVAEKVKDILIDINQSDINQ